MELALVKVRTMKRLLPCQRCRLHLVLLLSHFDAEEVPDVIAKIIEVFVEKREYLESFSQVVTRIGIEPFKQKVYASIKKENTHA